MKSKKRMVGYRDLSVVKNKTTSIVYGATEIKLKGNSTRNLVELAVSILAMANTPIVVETKGVAKLHPEDTYDEHAGKVVASIKAEEKGLKKADEYFEHLEELLCEATAVFGDERKKIKHRRESLHLIDGKFRYSSK